MCERLLNLQEIYVSGQNICIEVYGNSVGTITPAASAFRKLSSIYVFSYFPFGFEGRIWDLIVSVPDHCLSFYFSDNTSNVKMNG